ncbi:MAG: hemerythrin domain-containing protein [Candidatus Omnitrophica bacterium]|nr:hemerythrin domain-containing protein [Candidatus Omnitrophota bacterium]
MKTTDSLLHDHDRFRTLLDALDAALGLRGDTRFVVRELCFTLDHRLRDHMRRESELITTCRGPLGARELTALAEGHGDEAHALNQAIWQLSGASSASTVWYMRGPLELAIAQFRYHMDAQEYKLFPALAWSLNDRVRRVPDTPDALVELSPVNRVRRWEFTY